jgi:sec-independent protein translocase protein TatB
MDFLGMGWMEIMVILIVALLVVGPDRIPEYARKAGKAIRQFRRITSGVTKEISRAMDLEAEDEEPGREKPRPSIQRDLREIERSLARDAEDLKKSLRAEADSLQQTISESTRTTRESLAKAGESLTLEEPSTPPAAEEPQVSAAAPDTAGEGVEPAPPAPPPPPTEPV